MKREGATVDYGRARVLDLLRWYDRYISERREVVMSELYAWIVEQPARRFYVSETRACAVVGRMLRGEGLPPGMRGPKKDMFEEIYRRVVSMRAIDREMSVAEAVRRVVGEPAPRFYMAPATAKVYLYPMRKAWQRMKMRKLEFWQQLV